jgi:2-keto-4-pentenoate hydratase
MDWNTLSAEDAARLILDHRERGAALPVPPPAERPAGIAQAYAIQEALQALIEARGARPIGWKIGCTNAAARAHLGLDAPFYGRLYDAVTEPSPAAFPALPGFFRVFEPEIGLRIARDLPPAGAPYDAAAIAAATDALVPAIEIVGSRLEPWTEAGAALVTADNASHGCWVHGTPVTDWTAFDPMDSPIALQVDGGEPVLGKGRNVDGGPFGAAAWLANALAAKGRHLRAGDFISTGTVAPPVPVGPGQTARADFGALGVVEVRIGA